jgi:fumarate reductase subunit C
MSTAAHPRAMAPHRPGSTRTAPPETPASWPSHPRMRVYALFGATGFVYLLIGFLVLRLVWQLGEGPEAWDAAVASLKSPLYLIFHALSLVSVVFVGVRFFRLFPKSQPARIGPMKPPPRPLLHAGLYTLWIAATLVFALVLAGAIF